MATPEEKEDDRKMATTEEKKDDRKMATPEQKEDDQKGPVGSPDNDDQEGEKREREAKELDERRSQREEERREIDLKRDRLEEEKKFQEERDMEAELLQEQDDDEVTKIFELPADPQQQAWFTPTTARQEMETNKQGATPKRWGEVRRPAADSSREVSEQGETTVLAEEKGEIAIEDRNESSPKGSEAVTKSAIREIIETRERRMRGTVIDLTDSDAEENEKIATMVERMEVEETEVHKNFPQGPAYKPDESPEAKASREAEEELKMYIDLDVPAAGSPIEEVAARLGPSCEAVPRATVEGVAGAIARDICYRAARSEVVQVCQAAPFYWKEPSCKFLPIITGPTGDLAWDVDGVEEWTPADTTSGPRRPEETVSEREAAVSAPPKKKKKKSKKGVYNPKRQLTIDDYVGRVSSPTRSVSPFGPHNLVSRRGEERRNERSEEVQQQRPLALSYHSHQCFGGGGEPMASRTLVS